MQQRIFNIARSPFIFTVTEAGRDFLLSEGTDLNYGARHLKRAIERLLVQPLSNLLASDQIAYGDVIRIDHQPASASMAFALEAEGLVFGDMAERVELRIPERAAFAAAV